ncbi:hypothetical protein KDA23_04110 [Candidatus Saccharibacteria bacterium]|nr:hypothetical protein [Candidatus Saccharibacteria bacterium]
MTITRQKWMLLLALSGVLFVVAYFGMSHRVLAAESREFSLQVTPSPLVTTIKPGQNTTVELKIRNAGSQTEDLKIDPRSFHVDNNSGEINLDETSPAGISRWISFSQQKFTIAPGQWFTEKVTFSLPQESGFSYSFALVISRQKEPKPVVHGRLIRGSVAVFTLINVDRPGAKRELAVTKFVVTKRVYEFLPATFEIRFRNLGNTIVQPYGNIYIQRGENSSEPLAVLPLNEKQGYILPGVVRTIQQNWDDGFPVFKSITGDDGQTKSKLTWNWSNASNFRFGRYTAKIVAVYNDGTRDVPIEGEVSFWVIPWRILVVGLIVVLILGFGLWSMIRKSILMAKSVRSKAKGEK